MTELATTPAPAITPDLADLRRSVIGPVFDPGDVQGAVELAGANVAPQHVPVGVVGATGTDDVAAAVRWAAVRGIEVGVQATGHGSFAHRGSLVISTRRMDSVTIDPVARTATVGAGVKWARVVEAAAPFGLAGLNGSSTDVGVVGYTLGGGLGPFARRYGYASDRVRHMRVVTGDGLVHEVTAETEPDLFWALLGGKDVAGIVTEMTFELVEVAGLYGGAVFYDAADAHTVLHRWQTWAPALSEDTTTSIAILRLPDMDILPPPLRGRTVVHLRVAHLGDAETGAALMAPMRAVATPIMDTVGDMPYAAIDAIHMDPTEPMPSWETGAFLTDVTPETIDALLAVAGPQHEVPLVVAELRQADGAAARSVTGCLGRAGARYALGIVAPMIEPLREVVPGLAHGVVAALGPWATGQVPANWTSPETAEARPGSAWTEGDRERLVDVCDRTDPMRILGRRRYGL